MSAIFKRSGNKGVITLEGELTLPHAEELKGVFIKALQDADEVSIDFKNVRDVDLSCLQLFCAAHRSAVRLKKHVTFSKKPPTALLEAAETAGFTHLKGCKLGSAISCLWKAAGADHE
jgi:anti-anti-sigma regulatory factor